MAAYELEQRTLEFAIAIRKMVQTLAKNTANYEDGKQVIRSSGSIGANYIEANEKLGHKDLLFRLKIARKEAKESIYWLKIIQATNESIILEPLIQECNELKKILSSIIIKIQNNSIS